MAKGGPSIRPLRLLLRREDRAVALQAIVVEMACAAAMVHAYGRQHATQGLPLLTTGMSAGSLASAAVAAASADALTSQEGLAASINSTEDMDTESTALGSVYSQLPDADAAHLFIQRVLYRINRLCLFWFDSLHNYM
jgi:uncharacterized transporter YbjL